VKRATICFLIMALASLLVAAEPEFDGRYLLREVTYTLNSDGSWIQDVSQRMQYNSYTAIRRMGETFILFNPDFQKLEDVHSVTTMVDGTRVPIPDNATNLVLPRMAHEHSGFSHLREMVVTHTGLERGAVVDFSYRLITRADFQPGFAASEALAATLPLDRLVIRVKADSGQELIYATPFEFPPQVVTEGGKTTWTWVRENLSPACAESFMPPDQVPVLLLGTRQPWKAIMQPLNTAETLPEELQESLRETARESNTVVDKAVKIAHMVDRAVDLCHVPLTLSGWRYRSLQDVWNLHSATALEKTRLLNAALKAAGLPAQILVYSRRGWLDVSGPVLPQAQGFLVAVREDEAKTWYLDPSGETRGLFPEKLEGRAAYHVDEDRFGRIFDPGPVENRLDVSGELRFNDPEDIDGWIELHLSGAWVDYEKVMDNAVKTAEAFLKRMLAFEKLGDGTVREITPRSLRVRFGVESVKLERLSPSVLAFKRPKISSIQPMMIAADRRMSPLVLDHSLNVRACIAVVPGKDMVLDPLAKDINMQSGAAAFIRSYQELKNGKSLFTWEFRAPARVEPPQYVAFRELAAQALAATPWFTLALPFTR